MSEIAVIGDYDVRDKKLADAGTGTSVASTDAVVLKDTNGNYVEIDRDSFTDAIRSALGPILTNMTQKTAASGGVVVNDSNDVGTMNLSNLASVLGDILYAHIKYIRLDANTEARIGLNTNAGAGGNTLLIIGSYQWDGGTNTASFMDMVKFPYAGNSFAKTEIASINKTESIMPTYDEYYGDFVIKAKCATRIVVIYSRLYDSQYPG